MPSAVTVATEGRWTHWRRLVVNQAGRQWVHEYRPSDWTPSALNTPFYERLESTDNVDADYRSYLGQKASEYEDAEDFGAVGDTRLHGRDLDTYQARESAREKSTSNGAAPRP